MNFDDELLSETEFTRSNERLRTEYISKHCAAVEKMIHNVSSRREARKIADQACKAFEEKCHSTIIRNALIKRIDEIIDSSWN